jgi:hypothetical protein
MVSGMSFILYNETVAARAREREGKVPRSARDTQTGRSSLVTQIAVGVVTAVAVGALALIWNWASSGGLARVILGPTIKTEVSRIGPDGPATPEAIKAASGKESEFEGDHTNVPVPGSKDYSFCAISKIQLSGSGHCELLSLGQDAPWTVSTSGAATKCKVYCLKIGLK